MQSKLVKLILKSSPVSEKQLLKLGFEQIEFGFRLVDLFIIKMENKFYHNGNHVLNMLQLSNLIYGE